MDISQGSQKLPTCISSLYLASRKETSFLQVTRHCRQFKTRKLLTVLHSCLLVYGDVDDLAILLPHGVLLQAMHHPNVPAGGGAAALTWGSKGWAPEEQGVQVFQAKQAQLVRLPLLHILGS